MISLVLLAGVATVAVLVGHKLPSSFLPEEDQGYMYINVQLPNAASMPRTDAFCRKVEAILSKTPGIRYYATVLGFSLVSQAQTTYNALFFVSLKPWDQRTAKNEKAGAIRQHLNKELAALPEAKALALPPPAIPGIGATGGFYFILEDRLGRDPAFLTTNLDRFMAAAAKRPELTGLSTSYLPSVPQVFVNVDRDKVLKQGVDIAEVYKTLQTFMGGYFVNYFNRFGRQWQVYVEADEKYRASLDNLALFFVRNRLGQSVPLTALAKVEHRLGPEFVMHYNEYRSAQINGGAAPGYSSDQATKALEEVFDQTMPPGMGYDYYGMSFQEQQAAHGVPRMAIFGLSLIFVFLILAALYESWSLPVSVLISTPVAVLGAFLALWSRQFENNVYVQIGLIMLIGLSAKNAILIVEFAKREHERGASLAQAALTGARIRLRPILMTSFAFVFGCLPLWFASGAGGISRETLGTVVIGGMLGSTLLGIFIIPVNFYVVEKWGARSKHFPLGAAGRRAEKHERAHSSHASHHSHFPCPLAGRLRRRTQLQIARRPSPRCLPRRRSRPHQFPGRPALVAVVPDPVLQDLIGAALTNNYDLRLAAARVEESRALLAQSRSVFYPQVNYQAAAGAGAQCSGQFAL